MDEYKTTWREKLGYGIGAVGLDLSYGMFYSYLSYYLSSVLGLKEGFLLLLTPLARIAPPHLRTRIVPPALPSLSPDPFQLGIDAAITSAPGVLPRTGAGVAKARRPDGTALSADSSRGPGRSS